jgi:hypothetical protein
MDEKTLTPVEMSAQELARVRQEESIRQEMLRGGHTVEMREALQSHLVALVGEKVAREEAARTPMPDLPLDIAAMDPRAAAEQAEQIRKDPRYFRTPNFETRRQTEELRQLAQHLDRRAMQLPPDVLKLTPAEARAKINELSDKLLSQNGGTSLSSAARKAIERDLEYLRARSLGAE